MPGRGGVAPGQRAGRRSYWWRSSDAVPVDVGKPQLCTGVRALLAHDHPHRLGPARQREHAGDLSDPGTVPGVAVAVIGRIPWAATTSITGTYTYQISKRESNNLPYKGPEPFLFKTTTGHLATTPQLLNSWVRDRRATASTRKGKRKKLAGRNEGRTRSGDSLRKNWLRRTGRSDHPCYPRES